MSWLSNLMGGGNKNPANAAQSYLSQIPGQTLPYMAPYYNTGVNTLGPQYNQYASLINDPGGFLNKMGVNYQQSPGFKAAMENALAAQGRAAAAGGMAGTPQDQYEQAKVATDLSNQDYNNWLNKEIGLYGAGLGLGESALGRGQQAGQSMADMIAQQLASQAGYAYAGQAAENQQRGSWLNNIGRGIGALTAFTPYSSIGSAFSHFLGG